jgi:rhodanese-related sulfurtransferase
MNLKKILMEATIILVTAVCLGTATNSFRPEARKLSWTPRVVVPPKDPGLEYLEINGETSLRLHRNGAIFIDARRTGLYDQGHIENAISIPVWENDADSRIAGLPARGLKPDAVIVVYCSGGTCEDASRLATKLAQAGFLNIYVDSDGFPAWQDKGWPITRGKQ